MGLKAMGSKGVGLTLALVLVSAAATAQTSPSLSGWHQLSTPHLRVLTDGSDDESRALLRSLEMMRATLVRLAFPHSAGGQVPTRLILFTAGSYEPFSLRGRSGQFFMTPYESLIVVDAADRSRPARVIAFHEYLHALVSESGLRVPLWLNEGLAEYYSTLRVTGSRVVLGEPPPRHRRLLRGRAFLSFEELLGLESGASDYLDHEKASRFYAQSWLLVHFLMSDAERSGQMAAFLALGDRGVPTSAAFERAFGLESQQLDAELRRYLNRRRLPSFGLTVDVAAQTLEVVETALSEAEISLALGLVAAEQSKWDPRPGRVALAEALLEEATRQAPEDGDVVAARAYLAATLGQRTAAEALYERALYLDAQSARSYALYARLLLADVSGPEPRVAEQARLVVGRALELVPEHPGLQALQAGLLPW